MATRCLVIRRLAARRAVFCCGVIVCPSGEEVFIDIIRIVLMVIVNIIVSRFVRVLGMLYLRENFLLQIILICVVIVAHNVSFFGL